MGVRIDARTRPSLSASQNPGIRDQCFPLVGEDPRAPVGTGHGHLTLDCDVLTVQGADLRVIAFTAEPGSSDAEKLALLRVIGLQAMSG